MLGILLILTLRRTPTSVAKQVRTFMLRSSVCVCVCVCDNCPSFAFSLYHSTHSTPLTPLSTPLHSLHSIHSLHSLHSLHSTALHSTPLHSTHSTPLHSTPLTPLTMLQLALQHKMSKMDFAVQLQPRCNPEQLQICRGLLHQWWWAAYLLWLFV